METLDPIPAKKDDNHHESIESRRLQEGLRYAIEALSIKGDWKSEIDSNPYRFKANSELVYTQWDEIPKVIKDFYTIQKEYISFLNRDGRDRKAHLNDPFFLESLAILKELYQMQNYLEQEIKALEESIDKSPIMTERGCDQNETKKNWNEMNRKSAELPEDCWHPEKLKAMSIEDYISHVRTYGSGRSFCHTFPRISFEKGEIVTGIGGASRSEEGFQNIRDGEGGIQVNFTPESIDLATNSYRHRHYIGLGNRGGDVYFPAEVLLDNFAMLNLPYNQKNNWVSSEWRIVAPPENPKSELHVIPLSLGIVFFPKSFEKEYMQMINEDPTLLLPRVIFYNEDDMSPTDPRGLNRFLEESGVNKKNMGLPKISNIIRPITILDGSSEPITVFGTHKVKEQWG
jgi:hypothetical protein